MKNFKTSLFRSKGFTPYRYPSSVFRLKTHEARTCFRYRTENILILNEHHTFFHIEIVTVQNYRNSNSIFANYIFIGPNSNPSAKKYLPFPKKYFKYHLV